MSIKAKPNKDHLKELAKPLVAVQGAKPPAGEDPLVFFTAHPEYPGLVDLRMFATGRSDNPRAGGAGSWKGPFKGRPELILQLLPALKDQMLPLAMKSIQGYLNSLRGWWRVLDAVEAAGGPVVKSVTELSNVHKQLAYDRKMLGLPFSLFLGICNTVRQALGTRPLQWPTPTDPKYTRQLPPTEQTDYLRRALKHVWYGVIDRWERADELRATGVASDPESARLLANYVLFAEEQVRLRHPRPPFDRIKENFKSNNDFYSRGYNLNDMICGSFPDGDDIRVAFHLCLATTGWNPAVLLNIDAQGEYIEEHPKDPKRYVLRSIKARADDTEMVSVGLFKCQFSAGFIVQRLIARTAPLRARLERILRAVEWRLSRTADPAKRTELKVKEAHFRRGLRSAWLYAATNKADINWLDDQNYSHTTSKGAFIKWFIDALNTKLPEARRLAHIDPTDFRDAYALSVYRASGGSIYAVMKALGQRSLASTPDYLLNTEAQRQERKVFLGFANGLWSEVEVHRRIDTSVIAIISRDGRITEDQRKRLEDYRTFMTTRMGTKCADPRNPPARLDPDFVPNGKMLCRTQRCLLCIEHAVLVAESVVGIVKRFVALKGHKESVSLASWVGTSFEEELNNIELALQHFASEDVARLVKKFSEDKAGQLAPV